MSRVRTPTDSLSPPVSWLGLTAVYTLAERDEMKVLPVREQAFIHVLKAFTDGELVEG